MTRILIFSAVLMGAGMTSQTPLALSHDLKQAGTEVDTVANAATLAAPARGDLVVPVDTLDGLLATLRAVIAVDNQWRVARLQNDAVLLDSVLAEGWTTTDAGLASTGLSSTVETKAQFLAFLRSGERSYESIDDGEANVRIYGDAAVLTGNTTSKGYFKDQKTSGTSLFTRIYAMRQGRWQMIASHSSMMVL